MVMPFAAAALLSLALSAALARWLRRASVVDVDSGVSLLGGVAVATAMAMAALLSWWQPLPPGAAVPDGRFGWLAVAASMVFALGFADDLFDLSPALKVAVEALAAGLVVGAGYGFVAVTNPLTGGHFELGVVAPLASLAWIVLVTNAFNLIDGLDGLAAGVGLIAALTLIGVAWLEGRADTMVAWSIVAGALAGFLVFNFPPASIMLGDSGSLLLGFAVSVLAMQSLQKGATAVVLSVPILTLGLPLGDTGYAVVRRWLSRGAAAVVHGDRDHLHHRLLRAGLSKRGAVLVLYSACFAFSLLAFVAVIARGPLEAVLVGVAALLVFVSTRFLERRQRSAGASATGEQRPAPP